MKKVVDMIKRVNEPVIYTCSSPYNVLIAACLLINTQKYEDSYIIMSTPVREMYNYFKFISKGLNACNIKNIVLFKSALKRIIGLSEIKNNIVIYKILK